MIIEIKELHKNHDKIIVSLVNGQEYRICGKDKLSSSGDVLIIKKDIIGYDGKLNTKTILININHVCGVETKL